MDVFVAGATGAVGRHAVAALVQAGHRVRGTARGADNMLLLRDRGVEPVQVDLYDAAAVRRAVAGADAVVRLTTKIPPLMRFRSRSAWAETNRLRTEGARILVDAALGVGAQVYVHESVVFVYRDGHEQWIDETAPTETADWPPLEAALQGETEAARFGGEGRRWVVLRFAGLYGADTPITRQLVSMASRRMLPVIGGGRNYLSSIHVDDAGRAVARSVDLAQGIYNVGDDDPVLAAELYDSMAKQLKAPRPLRLPRVMGPVLLGRGPASYLLRSLRASNLKLKQAGGWQPRYASVREGLATLGQLH